MNKSALLEKKLIELNAKLQRAENDVLIARLLNIEKGSLSWEVNNEFEKLVSEMISSENNILKVPACTYADVEKAIQQTVQLLKISNFEHVFISFQLPNYDYPDWIRVDVEQFFGFFDRFFKWKQAINLVLRFGSSIYVLRCSEDDLRIYHRLL